MNSILKMILNVFFEQSQKDDFPLKVFFALFKAKVENEFLIEHLSRVGIPSVVAFDDVTRS